MKIGPLSRPWIAVSALGLALVALACSKSKSAETAPASTKTDVSTTPPPAKTFVVVGSVKLATDIAVADVDGLAVDAPINGATVFLKGQPDKVVKTDATGAFTIAIDTGAALTDASGYSLVMWYTTTTLKTRFGTQKDFNAAVGEKVQLGDVGLSYTARAKFLPRNPSDGAVVLGCAVTLPGYEGRVEAPFIAEKSFYGADYLPPADYVATIACPGFEKVERHPFHIESVSAPGVWQLGFEASMVPL